MAWLNQATALDTVWLEYGRGKWNVRCSGEMRRYLIEHLWRRQLSGPILTLSTRKLGERTGLDTPVVQAVNDGY